MKRERIGAIDVGTTKVCTIIAETQENQSLSVIGVGITPSHGLHKGLVVDINQARQSIRDSIGMAVKTAGHRLESVFVGVTGRHVTSINSQGTISITRNNQVVRPDDLKRVLSVARSVKVSSEQKLLHVIPRGYTVDGQEGVMDPVGMHGFRLDVQTHIITAAVTSVQNLTKCIRSVGVEIDDLVMEPLASAEAVLTPDEKRDGVLLADIGGGTTDLALFKDNTIYHTSVLPVAGYQVTRDLAIGLGIPFEQAEALKKKYGNLTTSADTLTKVPVVQMGYSLSPRDLNEIIRVRIEELLKLIMLELPQSNPARLLPAGIVLTGGGANLSGIAELGSTVTSLPVRVGSPMRLYGISDSLDNPAYATGVGLVLWKMRNRDKEIDRVPKKGPWKFMERIHRLFQRSRLIPKEQ